MNNQGLGRATPSCQAGALSDGLKRSCIMYTKECNSVLASDDIREGSAGPVRARMGPIQ
jgi:hypothetical protein